ncbi:ribonuclease P protein component [Salininema proteolyticum]|uniref:Ribonuclease P protein component n=1 Tax=Salininema proteolyticum TaxID=1607685 RepID=A0ABV8TTR0_9ACTN
MLSRSSRLHRPPDFARVFKQGSRAARGGVVIHWLTRSADAEPAPVRAGFVVSKKVGNAVVRNRVKRRLRALVAERLGDWPPADVVVRATPAAAERTWEALGADLDSAAKSAAAKKRRGGNGGVTPHRGRGRGRKGEAANGR